MHVMEHLEREVVAPKPSGSLISFGAEPGVAAQQIADMEVRIARLRLNRNVRSVLVTSAKPREGKTIVSVNLAIALARHLSRVLLVDGDLRTAGVARTLGLSVLLPGLAECIENNREFQPALRAVKPFNIHWLPAGCPSMDPCRVFDRLVTTNRMRELTEHFDVVIVDAPSLHSTETQSLADATDAVIIVARTGTTNEQQARDESRSLTGSVLAGVLVNSVMKPRIEHFRSPIHTPLWA